MPDDKNAQPNTDQSTSQPPKQPPIIPASSAAPRPQPETLRPSDTHKNITTNPPAPTQHWYGRPEWWMVITTVVLIAIGIISAVIIDGQLQEMAKQTGILNMQAAQAARDSVGASKQVERQLAISQQQATAAQNNVAAIQRQMRQDQRPWIKISFLNEEWDTNDITGQAAVGLQVDVSNTGKTPARNVGTIAVVEKVQNGNAPTFKYQGAVTISTVGSVWPGALGESFSLRLKTASSTRGTEPRILSRAEYQELLDGKAYIAVYARVVYDDIFGIRHWTAACNFFSPQGAKVAEFTAKKCTDYNNVDSN